MNIENVTTVEELTEFMDEEAAREGRADYKQATVNGKGIKEQWGKRKEFDKFPFAIFYMYRHDDRHELKSMWFDEEGNVTERPEPGSEPQ